MTLKKHPREPEPFDGPGMEPDAEKRDSHPIRSFLLFLLFMAIALLVFGALASRTAGFREIISVKNGEWFQTRLAIGRSGIVLPYDLVLKDVRVPAKPEAGHAGGLLIREVRVSWRPFQGLRVVLDQPELRLIQTAPGAFDPAELEALGSITNAAGIVDWLGPLKSRASLLVQGGRMVVQDADGVEIRCLEDIRLAVRPVQLPGRAALHYRLDTGALTVPGDEGYASREQEWLSMDGAPVVEIAFGVNAGTNAWGRHFWKGSRP